MLVVRNVTKKFGGLVAVRDVSFELKKGEILGLIGPNGAGKTTLFNMISGIYAPNSGTINFKGEPMIGLKPHRVCQKGVARTFQLIQPFNNMTVLENVMVGGFCRGSLEEARREAVDILKLTELYDRKDQFADSLTLAGRKRLELSRALATKPEVILLDEVIAGLNPTETDDAISLIKKIRKEGITLFVVEHVMRAIMNISDRIIVLHHGEKIAEGSPKEVSKDPKVIDAYLGETVVQV